MLLISSFMCGLTELKKVGGAMAHLAHMVELALKGNLIPTCGQ